MNIKIFDALKFNVGERVKQKRHYQILKNAKPLDLYVYMESCGAPLLVACVVWQ